jgi:cytochrome c peroxidase
LLRRGPTTLAAAALLGAAALGWRDTRGDDVANPRPVRLVRPKTAPLSAMAQLGRAIFFDSTLSASGTRSCASCHRPDFAYASPARSAVLVAVASRDHGVVRAIPSLRYAYRSPNFSVGPELSDVDEVPTSPPRALAPDERPTKVAGGGISRGDLMIARGGLFWDGRANTLQDQAMGPLFNPNEMGNGSVASVADKLRRAPYADRFSTLFGTSIFSEPDRLVDEAMLAVARFQIEDESFHPYTSKYDYYLEGKARLSRAEFRGLQAFDDEKRGNCAACHLDRPRGDGLPPTFTDYEYEALGVPRDTSVRAAEDLGACGPLREDLRDQTQYCGMFRTPTLRNSALRSEFFHNGVYRTLDDVLAFYNFRDTRPERIFPAGPNGVELFNDLPKQFHGNVDTSDAPFNRHRGDAPAMSDDDMRDIVAFLKTLTDGYSLPGGRTTPSR